MILSLLNNIVMHAYNTVPYYKELFDSMGINPNYIITINDLECIPALSKDTIQKAYDSLLSSDYLYYPESATIEHAWTSGSTGRVLKVNWSNQDSIRSFFHLWRIRNKVYGVSAESKLCIFRSEMLNSDNGILVENSGKVLSLCRLFLDENIIAKYFDKIVEFQPECLFIQPSVAYLFAKYINENNLSIPDTLKYLELQGEFVFSNIREKIEKVFKIPIANMYGCIEAGGIALECSHGNLHCLDNNVITEVLKDGKPVDFGVEGEVCITSLHNRAMPFIRYELGDRAILYPHDVCKCGNTNKVICVLAGRISDFAVIEGREPINSFVFIHIIEKINKLLQNSIKQFQVIQETTCSFIVRLVLEECFDGWKDTISDEFYKEIANLKLDKANWEFHFVDKIAPSTETGKLQFFISKLKSNTLDTLK